jgi:predicted phage terminase large subunit-like protein
MYIEDKSSGSSMLQVFKSKRMKVEAIQRNVDKEQRANIFGGFIEMGRVYLNSQIPNIAYLTDETVSFPNGVHDDTIDPMLDAIERYCVGSSKLSHFESMI